MISNDLLKSIGAIEIFRGLTDLRTVAVQCNSAVYEPNTEILGESEETTDIFFVLKGEVAAKSFSYSGREVTFGVIGPGQMFGEFSAIDGQPRSASICTLSTAVVARMTSAAFRNLLIENPKVSLRLAEHLVAKIRARSKRVFEFSTMPVALRIRAEIYRLCCEHPQNGNVVVIDPAPTHYDLATRLSTHREAVSRELNYLASQNLIELSRRRIRVLNVSRLKAMAEEGF